MNDGSWTSHTYLGDHQHNILHIAERGWFNDGNEGEPVVGRRICGGKASAGIERMRETANGEGLAGGPSDLRCCSSLRDL